MTSRGSRRVTFLALAAAGLPLLAAVSLLALRRTDLPPPWEPWLAVIGGQHGRLEPCGCTRPQEGGVLRLGDLLDGLEREVGRVDVLQVGSPLGDEVGELRRLKDGAFRNALTVMGGSSAAPAEWTGGTWLVSAPPASSGVDPERAGRQAPVGVLSFGGESSGSAGIPPPGLPVLRVRFAAAGGIEPASGWVLPGESRSVCVPDRGMGLLLVGGAKGLPDAFGYRVVHLDSSILPGVSSRRGALEGVLDAYLRGLETGGALAEVPRIAEADPEGGFAGSAACAGCHADQHRSWEATGHARSMRDLTSRGHGLDPECVVCHTVGWERMEDGTWMGSTQGWGGGHASPGLDAVGCEACHGRGEWHVRSGGTGRHPRDDARWRSPPLGTCLRCHDAENSPGFQERIAAIPLAHHAHWVNSRGPGSTTVSQDGSRSIHGR